MLPRPLQTPLFRAAVSILRRFPPATTSPPRGLVVFKPDRIGDFVLSVEAIRLLGVHAKRKCAEPLTLVIAEVNESLARWLLPEARIIALPTPDDRLRDGFSRMIRIARNQFGTLRDATLVCLRHQRNLTQDLLLQWLHPGQSFASVGCPFAQSPFRALMRFHPSHPVPYPMWNSEGLPLELAAHATVLTEVLESRITASDLLPRLPDIPCAESGTFLFFPFSSQQEKDYPLPKLEQVLMQLSKRFHFELILSGSPAQKAGLIALQGRLASRAVPSVVVAPNSLVDLTHTIAQAGLVLSMDSAPAHLATALDKRAVILIGGGHYGAFGPWQRSSRQIWLTHRLPCFGCDWNCCFDENRCVTQIDPDRITTTLSSLLSNIPEMPPISPR